MSDNIRRGRGGPREGSGRPPGASNRRTADREARLAAMAAQLKTILPSGSWAGDAVALAQSMYKDPSQPWDVRRDCMKIAAPYERPALSAVAVRDLTDAAPPPPPMLSVADIVAMARKPAPPVIIEIEATATSEAAGVGE
jgi:hypothetical protein